jgi:hypothetical protein
MVYLFNNVNSFSFSSFFLRIFSNVESTAMVLKILKEIQDEEERFCKPKDEHGNRTTERKLSSFFRERIVQHFQTGYTKYKFQLFSLVHHSIFF